MAPNQHACSAYLFKPCPFNPFVQGARLRHRLQPNGRTCLQESFPSAPPSAVHGSPSTVHDPRPTVFYNPTSGRRSPIHPAASRSAESPCAPSFWLPASLHLDRALRRLPDHHPAPPRHRPLPPHPPLLHRHLDSLELLRSPLSPRPQARNLFSYYGPLSLILLLVVWAAVMVLGFALIYFSHRQSLQRPRRSPPASTPTSTSAAPPSSPSASATSRRTQPRPRPHHPRSRHRPRLPRHGHGIFPRPLRAFSRREVTIALLDARAGSPPTAAELLRRHSYDGADAGPLPLARRVGALVRRAAREPHLLSAALLLPLPAQQPKLAQRPHRHPRHLRAAHRRRPRP